MAPVIIKKEATVAEAERYKAALEAMGARVNVVPAQVLPREESAPVQHTDEGPSPLDREPQVIPVRAKAPSPAEETAPPEQTAPQMVTCPQCGFGQSTTDECVKCGVIISKFLKYQGEVKTHGRGCRRLIPGAAGTPAEGAQHNLKESSATPISEPTGSTPWEEMASLGFITALFRTMKEVLFSPTAFFSTMPVNKGIVEPTLLRGNYQFFWDDDRTARPICLVGFYGKYCAGGGRHGGCRGILVSNRLSHHLCHRPSHTYSLSASLSPAGYSMSAS